MNIYKYSGKFGAKILSDHALKISHPSEFSDRFEFYPRTADVTREHARIKLHNPLFLRNFHAQQQARGCDLDFQNFMKLIRQDEEHWRVRDAKVTGCGFGRCFACANV